MARSTSAKSLREMAESGKLGQRQREVFLALVKNNQSTAGELYHQIVKKQGQMNQANITTRLGELRDMGVVKEMAKRKCALTGKTCIVWAVTGEKPKQIKKMTKQQKKDMLIEFVYTMYGKCSDKKLDKDFKDLIKKIRGI